MQADNHTGSSSPLAKAAHVAQAISLPTYKSNGLSMTSRTQGILTQRGSCLVVVHDDASPGDILIFPEGRAQWSAANNSLTYKGKTTKVGERIDLAGGSVKLKDTQVLIKNLPSNCGAETVWFA
jgi:hypothetical protein